MIKFFDYPDIYLKNRKKFLKIFDTIASKGSFILGKELEQFEKNIAKFANIKYAVGVGNATDALELMLLASDIKKNDEIIISSHTMIATASAIKLLGAKPVIADIQDDFSICPKSVNKLINSKTRAIIPTQINGRISDMKELAKIAKKNKLLIFEDAAQALGARYFGKHAGSFGESAMISFYPAKTLGTFGDAGIILTNKKTLYKKFILLRNHGRDDNNDVSLWGRNSRLDNIHAAFLDFQLKDFNSTVKRRREVAQLYNDLLSKNKFLVLPESPKKNSNRTDTFQNFEILAKNRNNLKKFLLKNNIYTSVQWSGYPLNHFKKIGLYEKKLKTDIFFKKILLLPCNLTITNQQIKLICDKINFFYQTYEK